MWPLLLRPAVFDCFSTSEATGAPLCRFGIDDLDDRAAAGGSRFDFNECHIAYSPAAKLISWPGFRHTYAFFQPLRRPIILPKRFSLPLTFAT
jgi:hypothetical protein